MNDIKIGDYVEVLFLNKIGKVSDIKEKKKRVKVILDEYFIFTDLKNVKKLYDYKKEKKSISIFPKLDEKEIYIFKKNNSVLDFHGYTCQEAIENLEIWIDKAIHIDGMILKIIHGNGSGILKNCIRNHFKKYKFIKFLENSEKYFENSVTLIEII